MMKTIRNAADEARKDGKQVKIRYQKLEIEGEVWKWNMERKKLLPVHAMEKPMYRLPKN